MTVVDRSATAGVLTRPSIVGTIGRATVRHRDTSAKNPLSANAIQSLRQLDVGAPRIILKPFA